jgi:hypothetical protein
MVRDNQVIGVKYFVRDSEAKFARRNK